MSLPFVALLALLALAVAVIAYGMAVASARRTRQNSLASKLYGSIVTQARQPRFYAVLGVPDTTEGRFEMIALHLFLVLERLRGEGEAGQATGRLLLERFIADMDDQMREIGIGDLAVPRRIQKSAAALQERVEDYRIGLAAPAGSDRDPLAAVLQQHLAVGGAPVDTVAVADYMRICAARLGHQPLDQLLSGAMELPAP